MSAVRKRCRQDREDRGICRAHLGTRKNRHEDAEAHFLDPEDRARSFADEIGVTFPVGHGMTVDQMGALGLYVSEPHSDKEPVRSPSRAFS